MSLEERCYRTLVVSSSGKFNENLMPLLLAARCDPIVLAGNAAEAKRLALENPFDFVVINAPLPDEMGSKFASDLSTGKNTVCLLFVRTEIFAETRSRVTPSGVFLLPKPTSSTVIAHGLDFLTAARERLRGSEKKALSLEEKMEEIRLVNRAKWLLIGQLSMTESDAHRWIEKRAMDTCVTRSEVAKEIIRTYS